MQMLKSSGMVIATFLAHPDDETLGCGGSIARAVEEGAEVHCIIPVTRIKESAINALTVLGVKNIHWGNFEDNCMDNYPLMDVSKFLEHHLSKIQPDIVITHNYRCMNQDHRVCYEAACIATRPVKRKITLMTCEVPSSTGYLRPTNFEPNYYVSISEEQMTKKLNALNAYSSEIRLDRDCSLVASLLRVRGAESGNKLAEGFQIVRSYE